MLSQANIEQYHEQGFVSPIDLFSEQVAAGYVERLQVAEAKYSDQLNGESRNNAHLAFTFLDELVHHPLVLDAVEDLIGPDFSLWGSVLFIKEPHSSHFVSWHQDATYMGITPHTFVTPWIALTPSNLESGCMSMIPGSHREQIQPHDDTYGENNILTRGQKIAEVDESSRVDLILRPGQMSLHHARIVHGSQPNRSEHRRIGYALQAYMPSGAEQTIGENQWMPMRGNPVHPGMDQLRRPQNDMDQGAIAERDRVNRNYSDILYRGASKKRSY